MKVSLPTTFGSAIATMNWSLVPNSNPMYYESLPSLLQLRQNSSSGNNKIQSPLISDILQNLPDTIDKMVYESNQVMKTTQSNPNSSTIKNIDDTKHYIMISLALICLGNGLGDEAHALVTPLSWNEETYFGGPSISSQASEEVVSLASYVHALVHRKEGFAQGEFGMMGYQNANYWSSATKSYPNGNVPFEQVRNEVLMLGKEFGKEATDWCQEFVIQAGSHDKTYWESRALHELCARTSRNEESDTNLKRFAEKAAEAELKVLLQCALNRAGYDINITTMNGDQAHCQETTLPTIDENVAQAIANKISSAHIGAFQSNGAVTIRNLFQNADDAHRFSVAAGLACRLMASPACSYVNLSSQSKNFDDENAAILIVLPMNEKELQEQMDTSASKISQSFAGGPLSVGDAFVSRISLRDANENYESIPCVSTFVPCNQNEAIVTFQDKFFGSRGETPTSVLQWSKGTIFKTDSLP